MRTKTLPSTIIKFLTTDGLEMYGALFKSKTNNRKIIIHEHGMCGNFYSSSLILDLAEGLQKTKYDLLSVNNRGSGFINRFQKGKKKVQIGTAFEKFEECIKDIDSAIKVATELGYKEIILSGHSTGSQKVTYYQAKKKNKKVKALLLLAPADDYNLQIIENGKKFGKIVNLAKQMVKGGKGEKQLTCVKNKYSAKRYLSLVDPKMVEMQLFNYSGKLKLFSTLTCPILAMFGSKEEATNITPGEMLEILLEKSNSKNLITVEVYGANHQFKGYEKETVENIIGFLEQLE